MNYKGAYNSGTDYSQNDVVIYSDDNTAYFAIQDPPTGTDPRNVRYWNRLLSPLQEVAVMFHGMMTGIKEDIAALQGVVFDDKTLVLASSTEDSDKKWAITVDDTDGIEVNEVVEEGEGD